MLKLNTLLKDHFPLGIQGIHVINSNYVLKMGFKLLMQFLNERMRNTINIHDSMESLHQHIGKDILPEEYDGTAGKLNNEDSVKAVISLAEYFQDLKKYIFQ